MGTSAKDIIKRIKDEEIEWVDVRFTDPKGKWQHLTMCAGVIGEDELEDGLMFDGSSIEGWKAINESDMILKPDLDAVYVDPFSATPMMIIFCDIVEPSTGELYSRDPRSTAKRAEAYLKTTGIGDTIYVGPEAEFFMFDDVRFENSYNTSYYKIDDIELPTNSGTKYESGNMGHRPRAKGGYFPVAPVDSAMDIRGEMVATMLEMGLPCDKHHHEVAAAQHELGLTFGTLTQTADRMQIYKYVVHQVAHAYGKTATFMPKPLETIQGSGMHLHLSLFEGENNAFHSADDPYNLSPTAKSFMAGLLHHAAEITAVTNQTINSYKRLGPGFEAPVHISWARNNRSGLIRVPIPKRGSDSATRIEYRSPDPACNPYLAFSVILAAGMRGIEQGYELPAEADANLFEMDDAALEKMGIQQLPQSLSEALRVMENSSLVADALGDHIFEWFLRNKRAEWRSYKTHISEYELGRYLKSI